MTGAASGGVTRWEAGSTGSSEIGSADTGGSEMAAEIAASTRSSSGGTRAGAGTRGVCSPPSGGGGRVVAVGAGGTGVGAVDLDDPSSSARTRARGHRGDPGGGPRDGVAALQLLAARLDPVPEGRADERRDTQRRHDLGAPDPAELGRHRGRRRVALGGIRGESARGDVHEGRAPWRALRHLGAGNASTQDGRDDRRGARFGEEAPPGQRLPQQDPDAVDVGARVGRVILEQDLGREVVRSGAGHQTAQP